MIVLYYINLAVLLITFYSTFTLFFLLFDKNSIVYDISNSSRNVFKTILIMLCISQLHAIEGDSLSQFSVHDIFRDVGILGLIIYVKIYIKTHHDYE